jgi:hypothetical protein
MDASMISNGCCNLCSNKVKKFWNTFRKIAKNPEGRKLLYRLLIEIRRNVNNQGGCAADVGNLVSGVVERNRYRSITITYRRNGMGFDTGNPQIFFSDKTMEESMAATHDVGYISGGNRHFVVLRASNFSAGLFHEMLHWFHFLRHTDRYRKERSGYCYRINNVYFFEKLVSGRTKGTLGKYYWAGCDGLSTTREEITACCWLGRTLQGATFPHFEEIRTILGAPTAQLFPGYIFFNGDEISENTYLVSKNLPIRFGHANEVFFEDSVVIQKALATSGGSALNLIDQHTLDRMREDKKPSSTFMTQGLGNFF